jgi:hypothetical protein
MPDAVHVFVLAYEVYLKMFLAIFCYNELKMD